MPFSKKTYSFRQSTSNETEHVNSGLGTPLRKIKSRGRSFIGGKTPTAESSQEESGSVLTPFARGSVRLRSIRKRKMANRDDLKSEETCIKRERLAGKPKDEIEIKIEENIKMRDGITKLLGGCHDTRQAMDIGKNLLTINSRMLSLMSSLQKKRSSTILKDLNKVQVGHDRASDACVGDLAVSEIRIPLLWKQDAHFKAKAGEQPALLYHMFCLLKINDQVFDTPLVQFNQLDTDITFNDVFTFHQIRPDFKLEVEVYYSVIQNPDNPVWTPIRTPKKYVYNSAPKYCLAAHAQLNLDDVKDGFVVSDFTMGGVGASATAVLGHVDDFPENPLALWGQFSCQLRARPVCFLKPDLDGHLLLQSSNGGQPLWEKYFCRLRNGAVQCWKESIEKEEDFSVTPTLSFELNKKMKLRTETNVDNTGRCIITLTTKESEEKEPVFAFENEDDFVRWKKKLELVIRNIKAWKTENYTLINLEEYAAKMVAFNKVLTYFDHNVVETKQTSPGLVRKAVKNSSRTSVNFPLSIPKVKSFYDQINIEEKDDLLDGPTASAEVCQDNVILQVSSADNELKRKNEADDDDVVISRKNGSVSSINQTDTQGGVKNEERLEKNDKEAIVNDDMSVEDVSCLDDIRKREGELTPESLNENTTVSTETDVVSEEDTFVDQGEGTLEKDGLKPIEGEAQEVGLDVREIEEGVKEIEGGVKEFEGGVKEIEEGVKEIEGGCREIEGDIKDIKEVTAKELDGAQAVTSEIVDNENSEMRESLVDENIEGDENAENFADYWESNDSVKLKETLDDVDMTEGSGNAKLEERPNETEESVLDYFMETINFAAELDECDGADITDETLQESAVDGDSPEHDMQPDLSENELQDHVDEGSDACTDYEVGVTESGVESNQEGSEANIVNNVVERESVNLEETAISDCHTDDGQTSESTELELDAGENESGLSPEGSDALIITSNNEEIGRGQESTTSLKDNPEAKSENCNQTEVLASANHGLDAARIVFDEEAPDTSVADDIKCDAQSDVSVVETLDKNEPTNVLSGECELTFVEGVGQVLTESDVTENDNVASKRKIETDV